MSRPIADVLREAREAAENAFKKPHSSRPNHIIALNLVPKLCDAITELEKSNLDYVSNIEQQTVEIGRLHVRIVELERERDEAVAAFKEVEPEDHQQYGSLRNGSTPCYVCYAYCAKCKYDAVRARAAQPARKEGT